MSQFAGDASASILLEAWVQNLGQVLESMTDQRPAVHWRAANGTAEALGVGPGPDVLSRLYKLQSPQAIPGGAAALWIATPRPTWEQLGTLTLQAAGLESVDFEETRKTWLEIASQWLAALARSLASHWGCEVTSEDGGDESPEGPLDWLFVSLRVGETESPPIAAAFSPPLAKLLEGATANPAFPEPSAALGQREHAGRGNASLPAGDNMTPSSRTLDLLLDVELPVSISFGRTQLPLKDVLKLTTGSIVELNRGVNEFVDVLVNHCLVARGEVVVVEGNYGVRIQQIASRHDRLRSLP